MATATCDRQAATRAAELFGDGGVTIAVHPEAVTFTGSTGANSTTTVQIPASSAGTATVRVPADILAALITATSDTSWVLDIDAASVTSGTATVPVDHDAAPARPLTPPPGEARVEAAILRWVVQASDPDTDSDVLDAVNFTGHVIEATDGYRLHAVETSVATIGVVPAEFFRIADLFEPATFGVHIQTGTATVSATAAAASITVTGPAITSAYPASGPLRRDSTASFSTSRSQLTDTLTSAATDAAIASPFDPSVTAAITIDDGFATIILAADGVQVPLPIDLRATGTGHVTVGAGDLVAALAGTAAEVTIALSGGFGPVWITGNGRAGLESVFLAGRNPQAASN